MIVTTRFPDLPPRPETSANAAFRREYFARWGRENMVFLAATRDFESLPQTAPLSVKLLEQGQATLRIGRREVVLEAGRCIIVNEGEPYSVRIASSEPARALSLHFRPGLAAEVYSARRADWSRALADGAELASASTPQLGDQLHAPSRALAEVVGEREGEAFEPLLIAALDRLMADDEGERSRAARALGVVRAATRDELRRRAGWAHDFILSNYAEAIALADIAAAAHLSKYHLLRVFHQVYGRTPLAALRARRAQAAHALLRGGANDLAVVAGTVGFGSRWAMQRALREAYGATGRALVQKAPADAGA
jgi:AraC family transcriptional regulator